MFFSASIVSSLVPRLGYPKNLHHDGDDDDVHYYKFRTINIGYSPRKELQWRRR